MKSHNFFLMQLPIRWKLAWHFPDEWANGKPGLGIVFSGKGSAGTKAAAYLSGVRIRASSGDIPMVKDLSFGRW